MNKHWLTDKDYDFIYSRSPRLCVDLVIKNSKGVLLTLRDIEPGKNTWHLPGGRVKFRESIKQAADRIAQAELGIKIILVKHLGFIEFLREVQNKRQRHSVSLVFLTRIKSGRPSSSWQAGKVGFFAKIPKKAFAIHAKFLKKTKFLKP